ncbi:unnamed protein product [Aphanomyces euteiches]
MNNNVGDGCAVEFSKYCRCKALFEPKYLRTHRAGGTKVLRCFPHCCPNHVYSSVCGTSIVVRVHGPLVMLENTLTYLRFDASYEPPLAVGDTMDENAVLSNLRHQTHLAGEWIASKFEVVDEKMQSRVYEFSPKSQSTLGWHYRWVGGSARQQRRAVHYLRAYVFVKESRRLRVVAMAQSSPFIVMSYRRACKACQRQSPDDEQLDLQCQCEGIYRLSANALLEESSNQQMRKLREMATTIHPFPVQEYDPGYDNRMETALATIHYFVSTFPISILAAYLDPFDQMLRVHPTRRTHSIRDEIRAHLQAPLDRLAEWSPTLQAIGAVVSSSTDLTPFIKSFSAAHAASLLSKQALEKSYAAFVEHVFNYFRQILAPFNLTPHALSDDILALCAVLHAEFPIPATTCVEKCRAFRLSVAFETFVAHMREIYMSFNMPPDALPAPTSRPLEGHWRYKALAIKHMSSHLCPSVVTLMRACYMGVSFQIVDTAKSFFIQSQHAFTNKTWAEFRLDGMPHVHRVFPDGESTMASLGGLIHGDYVAAVVHASSVALTLFSWPASRVSRLCYAVHFHLVRVDENGLKVDVRVAAAPEMAPVDDYWCMTVHERIALYDERCESPVVSFQIDYERHSME